MSEYIYNGKSDDENEGYSSNEEKPNDAAAGNGATAGNSAAAGNGENAGKGENAGSVNANSQGSSPENGSSNANANANADGTAGQANAETSYHYRYTPGQSTYSPYGGANPNAGGQTYTPNGTAYNGGAYSNGGQQYGQYGGQQYGQNPGYGGQYYSPYGGYGQPTPPPTTPPNGGKPPKKKSKAALVAVIAIVIVAVVAVTAVAAYGIFKNAETVDTTDGTETSDVTDSGDGDETTAADPSTGVQLEQNNVTVEAGTYAEVVEKTADSVVEITTEYASVNSFYYTSGAGSGVIIDEAGYIITCAHVIVDDDYGTASTIIAQLTDGSSYEAEIVGYDTDSDIAVLKIDAGDTELTAAEIGVSGNLAVGEEIIIIGNPLGTLGGTVTNGIISALDREITVEDETMNLLQTNAAVNPGNSGGGMFNMAGQLVGIVNAKYSDTGIEGLAFAIPIDDAVEIANEILEYGYVRGRVSLYISVIEISDYSTAQMYRVSSLGVYVYSTEEGYNDDVLQSGDRIVQINGTEISTYAELKAILSSCSVGDTLEAMIVRSGQYLTVTLTCYEKTNSDDSVSFSD
ncbi:MAG: trypsin-like peptidase domain-containing protein [Clostridiales bacterium]|nr:trypsin-like peptidase domain-containing protein [Clostridiales bacterium]